MISKDMHKAINDQINAELWSAYLYLSMSLAAEAKALKGISNWFFVQWLEEQDHARILENYLADQGVSAKLMRIDDVPTDWDDAADMFRDALRHEQKVTAMIGRLARLAIQEQDLATLSRLQWFVDEQVEEEKNAADVLDQLEFPGSTTADLRMIDDKLAARGYERASALE